MTQPLVPPHPAASPKALVFNPLLSLYSPDDEAFSEILASSQGPVQRIIGLRLTLPEWPLFGMSEDMRPAMGAAAKAKETFALATLYGVGQGGPRPAGSQMVFSKSVLAGFLSGGCIEADIAVHAGRVIEDGEPRHLVYGEASPWPDIQLLCGARLEILVERIAPKDPTLRDLFLEMQARRSVVWVTDGRVRRLELAPPPPAGPCEVRRDPFELRRLFTPTPRLAVVGADPTALAIASLGAQSGFDTTLVRPKGPATPPPLPNIAYSRDNSGTALADLAPDQWTAVAIATHDLEIDHDALLAALGSAAGYVGLVGARRRLPERLARLRAAGVPEASLNRLRAPIGLDLGGKAPWEIAVAVIAQIIADREELPAHRLMRKA